MEEFWILILVAFFVTNSFDKAESVQLEELPLQTFDELFVEEWWDKDEAEDLKTPAPTNFGQNVHHQIDEQNTQLGQIEPNLTDQLGQIETNSTDQLGQIEPNSTDQLGQIKPNSTDQNPPLTESDHSGQSEPNSTDQNPPLTKSDHSGQIEPNLTDQLGQIEPNSTDQLGQIETNSTDQLGQIEPNSTDQLGQIKPNSTDQNPPLTESDHSGQIKPNSTDQLGQIEPNSTDQLGQIKPNLTNQNPPLTESDHSDNANSSDNIAEDEQKREIIDKFHEIKDAFKQKGKFSVKELTQIEEKIAKHLKVNRKKIYKWKKEFGLSRRNPKNEQKNLLEKFDKMKAELKRDGFKNSYKKINETVAKELGLSFTTISNWKRKLGQTKSNKYPHSKQMELMKCYYEIKDQNPKISDAKIAKMLKIGTDTLVRWKKQFKRQQFHPNSVDGHSVEENAAGSNAQKIENSNSGSF